MRLVKFLFTLLLITVGALIYIYQQTLIISVAYKNEQKKEILDALLDRNAILRYKISTFSSLVYLDKGDLKNYADLQVPQEKRLVRLSSLDNHLAADDRIKTRQNLISKILDRFSRSAEARPINP